MKELILAAVGVAILAGVRAGVKSYKKRGKLDGMVIADAVEAATETVKKNESC